MGEESPSAPSLPCSGSFSVSRSGLCAPGPVFLPQTQGHTGVRRGWNTLCSLDTHAFPVVSLPPPSWTEQHVLATLLAQDSPGLSWRQGHAKPPL